MKTIDLQKLNIEIESLVNDRDWDQFHSVKNLAMALSVETSELLEIFQWLSEEQSNNIKSDPKTLGKVQDEVADIFIYLMRLMHKTGIDLEVAVIQKLRKNIEKYPIDKSRGNSKKYNEL